MRREFHVRFCEGLGVRSPRATRLVMVFEQGSDARRVQAVLAKRFGRFGLKFHPDKTRLVDYRRPSRDGGPGPGSFDFLGFTHYWGTSRKGRATPLRKTSKKRLSRALKALGAWMKRARHWPIDVQAWYLAAKLRGHFQYFGLRGNSRAISAFRHEALRRWHRWLSRRSQRGQLTWEAFNQLLRNHPLPPARLPPRPKQLTLANL